MSSILIVDDESEMIIVLRKFFTLHGFKVFSANGGQEALAILESEKSIDIMILDMRMPGMKGIQVLEKLKEKVIMVPVVILTGSLNFSHFVEKMASLGYYEEDVFFKPVKLEELLKHVNKRIKKKIKAEKNKKTSSR